MSEDSMKENRRSMDWMVRPSLPDIAVHEAGHVIMAILCGRKVRSVSILAGPRRVPARPHGQGNAPCGLTFLEPLPQGIDLHCPEYRAVAEREALVALGGNLAMLRNGDRRGARELSHGDLEGLQYIAIQAGTSQEGLEATLNRLIARGRILIDLNWAKVLAVAKALLESRRLTGEELAELLSGMAAGSDA